MRDLCTTGPYTGISTNFHENFLSPCPNLYPLQFKNKNKKFKKHPIFPLVIIGVDPEVLLR